jgi:hypothetical protein
VLNTTYTTTTTRIADHVHQSSTYLALLPKRLRLAYMVLWEVKEGHAVCPEVFDVTAQPVVGKEHESKVAQCRAHLRSHLRMDEMRGCGGGDRWVGVSTAPRTPMWRGLLSAQMSEFNYTPNYSKACMLS